ncbi:guanylate cyclase soluble subunit beta-2-like [Watersipora subatra]|uniref:guanylate cyclase soluble subunit beta-2-like n=1 Tax=Watersipora subatra TaxID=2589382 RepID=UPI00355B91F1
MPQVYGYGQIHCCVRALILEKFGKETWKKIVEVSKIDELKDFMVFHQYSDEPTMRLIQSVAVVAGKLDITVVLEVFGEYFLEYCLKHGYDKMLVTLGGDFETFIQNLDSLHALLQLSYKNIEAPSFRTVTKEDGILDLHYYSYRKGLYPIVKGLVREVGRRLFNCTVKCQVLKVTEDIASVIEGVHDDSFKEYVMFELDITHNDVPKTSAVSIEGLSVDNSLVRMASARAKKQAALKTAYNLSENVFCSVFPYHILFDENMTIMQTGDGLDRVCPAILKANKEGRKLQMTDVFVMTHPMMSICYTNIIHFINAVFLLQIKSPPDSAQPCLVLKGQIIPEPLNKMLFFIGSPRIESLADLRQHNIYLSDIPIYDVTRELVLLNQQRIAEIEVSKKLDETTAELKKMALELENEKAKTDRLLHEMLPKRVATQLKQGKTVEAEKFGEVTIFFSDIVTFTNIASASTPMEIVGMLNSLYAKFDELSSIHDVYKVETIGDAYMVVCGVPEPSADHAVRVADFALGAIMAAQNVKSPATGQPLQIRVGLHTGPVVAGVVGVRMPRYCLFGDTVNTASRMESHGVPECVHCSSCTYEVLQKTETKYTFVPRGENFIKGKGMMHTYFITSNEEITLGDVPEEAFCPDTHMSVKKDTSKEEPQANGLNGNELVKSNSNGLKEHETKENLSVYSIPSEESLVEMRPNRNSRACHII